MQMLCPSAQEPAAPSPPTLQVMGLHPRYKQVRVVYQVKPGWSWGSSGALRATSLLLQIAVKTNSLEQGVIPAN